MNQTAAVGKVKILVVDDSAIFRSYWARLISGQPDLEVVGSASNGEEALAVARKLQPDVVILDLEMPVLDGLSTIPRMFKEQPGVKILIASAFTTEGSTHAVEALSKGAADCIPKPSALDPAGSLESIRSELLSKIRALVPARKNPIAVEMALPIRNGAPVSAVAIGSSTGGPNALEVVLKAIPNSCSLPIFITQHMPPFFISALALRLSKETGRPCIEPKTGDVAKPGYIYIAPGDAHLLAEKRDGNVVISLFNGPPENFCRPAVDPMFRALAKVYGKHLLGVVLTGMGEDGKNGAAEILTSGGQVIAQDEASSVVWGMPGAVAKAGLASAVLSLDKIGPWIWTACEASAKRGHHV